MYVLIRQTCIYQEEKWDLEKRGGTNSTKVQKGILCCCCLVVKYVWLFVTPHTAAHQASLSFTISKSLLKFMSIESMMPSNHLILCCPLLFCPQSFPASGSFPMSQLFTLGGQSTGASASASVLPKNIHDWFPLGLTAWISLQSKGLSRVFSNTTVQKHQRKFKSFLYIPTLTSIHDYWKNHSFD